MSMSKYFDKTDKTVLWVTIISLIYIIFSYFPVYSVAKYLHWPKVPEILRLTSFSILAAGIFYFITIYADKRERQRWTVKFLTYRLKQLNFHGSQILNDIYSAKKLPRPKHFPNPDELRAVCAGISLMSQPPQTAFWAPGHNFETWYQYFEYFFQNEAIYVDSLALVNSVIPNHLVAIIDYLIRKPLERALFQYKNSKGQYDDMAYLYMVLWAYLNITTHASPTNTEIAKFAIRAT